MSAKAPKRNWLPEKDKVSRKILMITIPATCLILLNIFGALRRPESPLLLTSLAAEPRKLSPIIRISYVLLHGYLNVSQYIMPIFHLTTAICYIEAVLPMIRAMSLDSGLKKVWKKGNLTHDDIYHAYHELSYVQTLFNCSYSTWALFAQTYFTAFSIVNIFQAVALSNKRGLFAGAFLCILGCLIFKHLGHVFETSKETLHTWKEVRRPVWFRKFSTACRPFRVAVGPFYYADYTLVLAMISVIFVNSVNVIVTYKDA